MMRWSCGMPVRVTVLESENRGVWLEFETQSFLTRYLVPHGVAGWMADRLARGEAGSREICGDDGRGV
jgi:hypothetical protein